MLAIKDLQVSFSGRAVLQVTDLKLAGGKVHGIIGLNGAGKSTFFNVLSEVVNAEKGEIIHDGKPLKYPDIAYLETSNFFYASLTGREYLNIFPKTNPDFKLHVFRDILQLPLDQLIETYSTGMKKKLALLAILQQNKPVYMLDEPFNGLDLESNRALEMIMDLLRKKGKTVLVSAHILEPLLHTCDQIHLLQNGRFIQTFEEAAFPEIREKLFAQLNQDLQNKLGQAF
ncbi:ATP-binding cassette domain-containing protein [Adhaeribacter sp. BT258]|uniref:ATP-binding cassette domain-containing protein n=1 Tax=Adhaeribacter terrigena TaxID=2793070 RepID=A0ABS1C372_9BACT|nr:ATP-binding cassette domain-containing protein [Adhaeribacter terrigena]MBK0403846.1 ATP-binding cassette domain-containing protein [Adhaeribacter terrigena]